MRELLGQQKGQDETRAANQKRTARQNLATGEPVFCQPVEPQSWESVSEAAA
jgi:hypothetical protein